MRRSTTSTPSVLASEGSAWALHWRWSRPADPTISDRVDFVNAFGPFYDAEELLLQAVSGTVEYDGENTPWQPDPHTLRVLAAELIERLDRPIGRPDNDASLPGTADARA